MKRPTSSKDGKIPVPANDSAVEIHSSPACRKWDSWFDSEHVTADFIEDTEQPSEQQREPFRRQYS